MLVCVECLFEVCSALFTVSLCVLVCVSESSPLGTICQSLGHHLSSVSVPRLLSCKQLRLQPRFLYRRRKCRESPTKTAPKNRRIDDKIRRICGAVFR